MLITKQKSRHCGLNPQSPANNALNKGIAGQARNDASRIFNFIK